MTMRRVTETEGVSGAVTVQHYDQLMRRLRDRGFLDTDLLLDAHIRRGRCLEIGPGPGYLGLEWLKATEDTILQGLDISAEMLTVARKNAQDYGLASRASYVEGRAQAMPFDDGAFDAAFFPTARCTSGRSPKRSSTRSTGCSGRADTTASPTCAAT